MNLPTYCFSYVFSSESVRSERLEIAVRVEKWISSFTYDSIYAIKYVCEGEGLQKKTLKDSQSLLH